MGPGGNKDLGGLTGCFDFAAVLPAGVKGFLDVLDTFDLGA